MARRGDSDARDLLYRHFLASTSEGWDTGATQIVEVDGLEGFLFVADRLAAVTEEETNVEDFWTGAHLLSLVEEQLGEEQTASALGRAAAENPRVAEYIAAIRAHRTWATARKEPRRKREMDYAELRRLLPDPETQLRRFGVEIRTETETTESVHLAPWGMRATDQDVAEAVEDLLGEDDKERLLAYLRIFQGRRFPLPHSRLLSLATGPDDEVACAALFALANLADPEVRALALELIEHQHPPGDRRDLVLDLLVQNYREGDHRLVERLLSTETDRDEFHALAMGTMDIFKVNRTPDAQDSLMEIYERGSCSMCRGECVNLLYSLGLLPDWVREECRYDSNPDIRAQALD